MHLRTRISCKAEQCNTPRPPCFLRLFLRKSVIDGATGWVASTEVQRQNLVMKPSEFLNQLRNPFEVRRKHLNAPENFLFVEYEFDETYCSSRHRIEGRFLSVKC